ncbi:porin [Cupriavidus sp. WKF15]|uniref:porin n=1 Tax=Cupriavidus sp. WKF15 TaxID=3032282 RepID=UPI0023E2DB5F|nr:porin [Cupriavidus sp. WKF15]WER50777.1 porin [Cupriavidus sp. WKF15]
MKRSAFLLAAMGLFVECANAQSSVTLYGVVDSNVEYVNNHGGVAGASGSVFRVGSGGFASNRWGIRGIEDLGGLSGVFTIESGFNVDTGTQFNASRLYDRQTFVGLKSSRLGQLTFGRQYTAFFRGLANYSPSAYAPMYEPITLMTGLNFRSDNTVSYEGQFGALTARANWTFGNGVFGSGETPGSIRANAGYGAALDYSGGDFGVTVAYDQYNPTASTLGDPGIGKFRKAAIAAGYNLGQIRIFGGYRWGKNDYSNGATAYRDDFLWAGVNYQATSALNFMLAYYYAKVHTVQATFSGTASSPANPYQVSLMSSYAFSKRTNVYLTTAYSKHAALGLGGVSATAGSSAYQLGIGKDSQFGTAIGIRHIF